MKRIYFELDNPAFIAWLKIRPTDSYKVLLGSDSSKGPADVVFAIVAKEGASLSQWLVKKLQAGEMQLHVNTKIKLPQVVILE